MKTIFEQGALGHGLSLLPACDALLCIRHWVYICP